MVSGSDFERAFHSYYVLFYIVFQSFSLFFRVFHCFYSKKRGKGRDYQWDVSETGGKDEGKDEGKRK
jgi:hypothetical protein